MLCTGCRVAQTRIEQAGLTIPYSRIRCAQVCGSITLALLVASVGMVVSQHCHILGMGLLPCSITMGTVIGAVIASLCVFTSLGHYASVETWLAHQCSELDQEALNSLHQLRKERERANV